MIIMIIMIILNPHDQNTWNWIKHKTEGKRHKIV